MGCHTWFSVPYKTDKNEIIELAKQYLVKNYQTDDFQKMYEYAIIEELQDVVCQFASDECDCGHYENWILYKDVYDYSLELYNKDHDTSYSKYDNFFRENDVLESYSDEPRIGGYPERIIRSYDEMVEFIKTGHDEYERNGEVIHCDFYIDENRIEKVMNGIKEFFIKHPDGIITFG